MNFSDLHRNWQVYDVSFTKGRTGKKKKNLNSSPAAVAKTETWQTVIRESWFYSSFYVALQSGVFEV